MALKKYPATWNNNQAHMYGQNNASHIQSSKQFYNPVKQEADAIKECFSRDLYWENRWVRDKTLISLDPVAELLTVNAPEAFLRNGYRTRIYGKVYVFETPKFPNVGETIAPVRHPIAPIYEDVSGKEWCQMSAAIDSYKFEFREIFQEISEYGSYWAQKTEQLAEAFAIAINAVISIALAASFGFTLTTDAFVVPFFNSDAIPTDQESKAAKDFYDKNGFLYKYLEKDVIPQIQEKFTNKVFYMGDFYSPYEDSIEITDCSEYTIPANGIGEDIKKIYFKKEGEKQKTHTGINRHSSLVSEVQAIKTQLTAMSSMNSVTNMAFYKPYQKTKQTNTQDAIRLLLTRTIVFMNIFDKVDCEQAVGRTSASGNYTTDLQPIKDMGVTVVGHHAIPPGCASIREFGFLQLLMALVAMYKLDHPYVLGETIGGHQWIKMVMTKFTPAVDLIPTKFVPSEFYYTHEYNTLKVA